MIDVHCHLQDARLARRIETVLAEARAVGVMGYCCCGTHPADWRAVSDLAVRDPAIVPAYGLHPWHVRLRPADWLERLAARLHAEPLAVVGEIGLDRAVADCDDADQCRVFQAQIRLARGLRRPVVVHCRRAWGRLLEILEAEQPLPRGFVIHAFAGAAELIPVLARLGGWFSFSGSITRAHHRRARTSAIAAPADRLLVETDAPDLIPWDASSTTGRTAPVSADGVNAPCYLPLVVRELAALRGVDADSLATLTTRNARTFLGLPEPVNASSRNRAEEPRSARPAHP